MKYYTIYNNNICIADNQEALTKFYDNVFTLPNDYEVGKYIVKNGELVLNPNWEEEKAQQEAQRILSLKCTKRVFALILQQMGVTYTQLKNLIATNDQAQLEWDLCVELERSNPLLNIMAVQLGFTSEQLDNIFKIANGEITMEGISI